MDITHNKKRIAVLLFQSPSDLDTVLDELFAGTDVTFLDVQTATNFSQALELLEQEDFEAILLDIEAKGEKELAILSQVYQSAANIPIIVMTHVDDESLAVKAVELGAQDYVIKDHVNSRAMIRIIRYAIERKRTETRLKVERAELTRKVEERTADLSAANAELARAARLKDEFLANMSHELRTPMSAVIGLAEALQMGIYGDLNEKQIKAIKTVEESGHHLLSLINDILDVAKLEAGKLELDIFLVSIESVCQSSLRLVEQMAHEKEISISSRYDEKAQLVRADERSLKQILVNLLSNAIKFTPKGGKVSLEVTADLEERIAHFTVKDTGIGIAEADMPNLFKPFVQADSSLARQYGGTGLGLALVSRLTELHGGGISVDSVVGKGSRFTISLPELSLDDPEYLLQTPFTPGDENKPGSLALPSIEQETRPLILLAEDNEANVTAYADYLRNAGYRVQVARDGLETLERVKEIEPNLILMDIHMPGLSGIETIKRVRSQKDLTQMPIIALTALAMPGDYERCISAGANQYLSKPISLKRLHQEIIRHLDNIPSVA